MRVYVPQKYVLRLQVTSSNIATIATSFSSTNNYRDEKKDY